MADGDRDYTDAELAAAIAGVGHAIGAAVDGCDEREEGELRERLAELEAERDRRKGGAR